MDKRLVLLACSLLALPGSAAAVDSDIQLWPTATFNHAVDEQWATHLQVRLRADDDVRRTRDLKWSPFASWRPLESLTVTFGYQYLDSFRSASEHRLFQSIEHRLPWRGFFVKNRLRLDQRFVDDAGGGVVRLRYRLRGVHPIGSRSWYTAASNEILVNLNNQGAGPVSGFEGNRLRVGLGGRFHQRVNVEAGYEWQYVEGRVGPATNKHVFLIEFSIETHGRLPIPYSPL